MSSDKLFKYYPPESFDFIVTKEGISIRFSQPESLNDPFESLPILKHEFYGDKHIGLDIFPPIPPYTYDEKKEINEEYKKEFYSSINNSIGILSLSKKSCSRPMWAYYSKDHTGFVIEFSYIESGLKEINSPAGTSGNVIYDKERPSTKEGVTATHMFKEALYKDSQWSHEEEYRITAGLNRFSPKKTDGNGFPLCTVTLPYDYVSRIIIGVRASIELERKALFYIKNFAPHISLDRNVLCSESYQLVPQSIWKGRTTDTPTP